MVRRRWATPDGRRRWTFPDEYDWPDYSHEYDTQGYRDPADYLTMTQPREEAAMPQSGCQLCGSHGFSGQYAAQPSGQVRDVGAGARASGFGVFGNHGFVDSSVRCPAV